MLARIMEAFTENTRFGSMTIAELRGELKKRGAKMTGRKKDLIERLQSYERNFNFGKKIEDNMVEYNMSVPMESSYKDLHEHTSIPHIDMDKITSYLEPLRKKVEKESVNLARERFLCFIKTVQESGLIYFKSQCRAEMRKSVKYNLDISVDIHGCVQECQCDCGSGMGPEAHCKHVIALLYALHVFCDNSEILIEFTCTQQLQTFHQAKRHQGSPIKAKNLTLSYKKKKDDEVLINFDPRPASFKNTVQNQHHFRNVILNFNNVGCLPVSNLFPPANIPALCHDHDYMEQSPEDVFLQRLGLSEMTREEQRNISERTVNQSSSKDWIEMRCFRMNSSDFGRICKLTSKTNEKSYASSLTVFSDIQAAPLKHGRKYEKVAVRKFQEITGNNVTLCGTLVSLDYPFLASSPDGLIGDDCTLEVKCPYAARDSEINQISVPYLRLDQNNELILNANHDYHYQIQGQLLCSERQFCYFCIFTFKDFKIIKINRDDSFISEMVTRLSQFYNNFFKDAVIQRFLYKNYNKYKFDD